MLNDPGRLLAVHMVHTGLVAGWAGSMSTFEAARYDPTDPRFNPMWRQGMYVMPFQARLGCTSSWAGWRVDNAVSTTTAASSPTFWTIEGVAVSHIFLAGLLWAASLWHWVFWDLDVFRDRRSNNRVIDSPKLFGIHLLLSGLLCGTFGSFHAATFPGIWISDVFSLAGGIQPVQPDWTVRGFDAYNPGGIVAHHLAAGLLGVFAGIFHLSCRPSKALYILLRMGNIETVLASSIVAVAWAAGVVSATMWYGSAATPVECFGPTRYVWDLGLFIAATEAIVQRSCSQPTDVCIDGWRSVPDSLAFYDYVGHNPAKGGLFRSGAMKSGDGIAIGWLGHPTFRTRTGQRLFTRRMPSFFESFPVILVDERGTVRADQPFRRAESKYALERLGLVVAFNGGALDGLKLTNKAGVAGIARRAQFGELLEFDRQTSNSDGVLRTSPRGWFTFAHISFGLLFLFGHWWHASRTLYRDLLSGIDKDASVPASFGDFMKVGDVATVWIR